MLLAACDTPVSDPGTTTTQSADPVVALTTTTAPPAATTTTGTPQRTLTVRLDPGEALAARGGVAISVTDGRRRLGSLTAEHPEFVVAVAAQARLTFTYPDGTAWDQPVPASGEVVARQPWRVPPPQDLDPVAVVWQSLGDRATYLEQLDRALPTVDTVSPIRWYVGADGSISGGPDPAYIDAVHQRGVASWPAVAGLDADANHALLADADRRSTAARRISAEAKAAGADGVNVDIEGFRDEDADHFTAFVTELATLVHEWGGVVSVDLIPRSDSWDVGPAELAFWSTAPQRRALAEVADLVVLMAYDQHNRYRPAGPVAAPRWVDEAVTYALRFVDPHRLVLGVPFYGRIWDPEALEAPRAVGHDALAAVAASGTGQPDPTFGLDRVELPDGRFLWWEGVDVIAARVELVERLGLAGWAGWRFGLDSTELWTLLAD